jgi:Protein of unknown function (DUF664)
MRLNLFACRRYRGTQVAKRDLELEPIGPGRYSPPKAILHMIEETARHAGHADLIRERIDNTTGYLPPKDLPY